jgi:hypothetical protein
MLIGRVVPIVLCDVVYAIVEEPQRSSAQGYIIVRDIVTVDVCDDGCGQWRGCFLRLQGLFVYGRHWPTPMISLAAARAPRARLPAQHSSPGQQSRAINGCRGLCKYITIHAANASFIAQLRREREQQR